MLQNRGIVNIFPVRGALNLHYNDILKEIVLPYPKETVKNTETGFEFQTIVEVREKYQNHFKNREL